VRNRGFGWNSSLPSRLLNIVGSVATGTDEIVVVIDFIVFIVDMRIMPIAIVHGI
jgi:hypothetical protein